MYTLAIITQLVIHRFALSLTLLLQVLARFKVIIQESSQFTALILLQQELISLQYKLKQELPHLLNLSQFKYPTIVALINILTMILNCFITRLLIRHLQSWIRTTLEWVLIQIAVDSLIIYHGAMVTEPYLQFIHFQVQ
jgi:hypothetical protein